MGMIRQYPETAQEVIRGLDGDLFAEDEERRCAVTDDGKWCAIGSLVVVGVVLVSLFLAFRSIHLAAKGRPGAPGAAGRVIERVNGEAAVRFCNRVADAVFGVN